MVKLQGNISAYMIGVVAGVTLISTVIANNAEEQKEAQEQSYLIKKKEQRQKLAKVLENVVSTKKSYTAIITDNDLKKYYYSNAFDVTADLELSEITDEFSEEKIRQEQIYKSYANMKKQAEKMYLDVIENKAYMWPDIFTSYIKDAWNRDFIYSKKDDENAQLSFNLPWNVGVKKILKLSLPVIEKFGIPTVQQQKLQASDKQAYDEFAISVDIDGDTAVVGAHYEDTGGSKAGAAYIYVRKNGVWSQQQKIQASDKQADDKFGSSVSISGNTVVVGAAAAGSAYIFTRSGKIWTQQQKIQASGKQSGDYFGVSVSVENNTLLIGAHYDDSNAGSAYIFTRSGNIWRQQQKIQANDKLAGNYFGSRVVLDNNTLAISSIVNGTNGAVYIFVKENDIWKQQQKLQPNDSKTGDWFAYSLDLDKDSIIVGARITGNLNAGAVYIFTRSNGVWSQQQKIEPSDGMSKDYFGTSVAISGNVVIVGAFFANFEKVKSGAAYVFTKKGIVWNELKKIQATDALANKHFGSYVAISNDTAIIGAKYDDTGGTDVGAAYIFVPEN